MKPTQSQPFGEIFCVMEQVKVIGMIRRALRLELIAGVCMALAFSASAWAASSTTTTLSLSSTQGDNGITEATLTVNVTGTDGQTPSGVIELFDEYGTSTQPVAQLGATLSSGQATVIFDLAPGSHSLTATYLGDSSHGSSTSSAIAVTGVDYGTFNFASAVDTPSLTLTAGQSNQTLSTPVPITMTITPVNVSGISAPNYVTLSCTGLPEQATCSFNPTKVVIQPGDSSAVTSSLSIQTQAASTSSRLHPAGREAHPIAWAFLLPGALALAGAAFGARRRVWLRRVAMMALLAMVTLLGATACNPRYDYLNHGPVANPGTPAGTYTVTIDAQGSYNGTAITHDYTTLVLTVN